MPTFKQSNFPVLLLLTCLLAGPLMAQTKIGFKAGVTLNSASGTKEDYNLTANMSRPEI